MNRLLLAFGLVCLLQGLSAEPRPEFALNGTVPASIRITAVKNDANVTATAIKALNVTTVNSAYPGLVGTKTQIEKVITDFDTKAQAILAAYDTLLAANDGNVSGQFDAFVTTINATITYISTDASNVTAELGVFNYTGISDELTDAFEMQQTNAMIAAFIKISTSLTSRIATLQAGFNVLDFPLFKQLVDTLMGNDEYGRYCYQKYKELGKGIFGQAFDSAWQCVDNEYARLEYLKITLGFMIEILAFDYEDVIEQVKVCDNLTSGDNLNNCVSQLANFYTNLFPQTANKISTMYQLATDEATASENRILICIELVYIQGTVLEPQKISDNLAICSRDGPKGSD
uniref:Protein TsetseEP domain-containing protein n=1 Tax=Anopheles arabiensis TaxID=7173 RepID=A0A2C9GRU8_ANOAR